MYGERRWRDPLRNMLYTWDWLHGEIEAFSLRGEHRGALHPLTGQQIKLRERETDSYLNLEPGHGHSSIYSSTLR
jgi:hypothetical protein